MTPKFDFFFFMTIFKSPIGQLAWYVDSKYGKYEALD